MTPIKGAYDACEDRLARLDELEDLPADEWSARSSASVVSIGEPSQWRYTATTGGHRSQGRQEVYRQK